MGVEILLGAVCAVAAVTVIGHGLWVLFTSMLRAADGPATSEAKSAAACPRCGLPLIGKDARCLACEWPRAQGHARLHPMMAMHGLVAQIEQLQAAGLLEPRIARELLASIATEKQHLAASAPAAAQQAAHDQVIATSDMAAPEMAAESIAAETIEPLATSHPAVVAHAPTAKPPTTPPVSPAARDTREFASELSVGERAARVAARQQQAALQQQAAAQTAAVVPAAPIEPARSWTDWLAAFMEERNMRWGELIGGLLIVCGSIALVVSFWSAIAERPWLKFFLFGGVTAGIFGIGFYSEHRWRLHTTSQGLLTIASLLVPLNFLAIAAFSDTPDGTGLLTIVGEVISAGMFAALIYFAGEVLLQQGSIALVTGVLVPSVAQLLVRRYVDPTAAPFVLIGLAAVPVAVYLLVNGITLERSAGVLVLSEQQTNSLFKFFGLTTFAALLPLALILVKSGHALDAARQLSMMPSLFALVPLSLGLLIWRKLAGRDLAGLRVAGTSIAVLGAVITLAGLVLAWPDPLAMLMWGLIEFAVFTFVAWRFSLPWAHVPAALGVALSYLLGAYAADGQITWSGDGWRAMAAALFSGQTGTLLAPLVLLYGAVAFVLLRARQASGLVFGCVAGGLALVSTALVSWFGFGSEGDPIGAAWVYLLYAAGCLVAAARTARVLLAWAGAALLLTSVVQFVVFRYGEVWALAQPEVTALLVFCTLTVAIALVVALARVTSDLSPLVDVLWNATFFCSLVAAGWLALVMPVESAAWEGRHWWWLSAVWLAVALATGWLVVGTLFQVSLVVATIFVVVAGLERRAWFTETPRPWLDPWTLEAIGIALAALSLAWVMVRLLLRRWNQTQPSDAWSWQVQELLSTRWLSVDRVTAAALVALVMMIGTYAALPGVLQELSPRHAVASSPATPPTAPNTAPANADVPNRGSATALAPVVPRFVPEIEKFQLFGINHQHAGSSGAWLLLASMLILLAGLLRERISSAWLLSTLAVVAVVCPLLASSFEGEVAVASALRWLSAGLLLVGSIPIWCRTWIAERASRLGYRPDQAAARLTSDARLLVFVLSLFPPVAMAVGVGVAALGRSPVTSAPGELTTLWTVFVLAVLAAAALCTVPQRVMKIADGAAPPSWPWAASALLLVLGTAPILSMLLYHVGIALKSSPILGPDPQSIFFRMGLAASYAAPILMTALVLIGHAVRERSSGFGLAGGLVLSAGATAAYLLAISKGGLKFDGLQWIRLAQLNAAVSAAYALAWIVALVQSRRRRGMSEPLVADFPLSTALALAPALFGLALGSAWLQVFWTPQGGLDTPEIVSPQLADAWGLSSFALTVVSVLLAAWSAGRRLTLLGISALLIAATIFVAVLVAPWDSFRNWYAYNTLLVGHCVAATVLLALVWRQRGAEKNTASLMAGDTALQAAHDYAQGRLWIALQSTLIVLLAAREMLDRPWWSAGGFGYLGVAVAPAAAWLFQRQRYLYLASLLINIAGTIAWVEANPLPGAGNALLINILLVALPVVPWLLIDRERIQRRTFASASFPPAHRMVTRLAVCWLVLITGLGLLEDATQNYFMGAEGALCWGALAMTVVAALALLWDVGARDSVALLYVLGFVACGMLLDALNVTRPRLLWTSTMVASAYAVLTSYLWSRRKGLVAFAERMGVPPRPQADLAGHHWLVPCNLALIAAVVMMTVTVELTEKVTALRLAASQATLAQVISLALLARGDRRGLLQTLALQLGAVGAVLFGWSWLQVGSTLTLLHALVVVAAAIAAVAVLYGFGLGKLLRDSSDWLAPARRMTPVLAAICAASVFSTLAVEVYQFSQAGEVQMAWPAILTIAVTLAALAVAALAAAVLPGRDPLNLSERGRMGYVYGAEIMLALLFVHIRLTMPWLFSGFFMQYWPLIVMAIAALGVGFAEICRRRNQNVLAQPIENTGALLPVLPVVGFWVSQPEVDYSFLLVCVGLLYATLSIARRSFGFGVLAALAANGGLWYFLSRQEGLAFLMHPQIWLIPPALCVLAAAYLNRDQLSASQMTAVRYFTSMIIYISSTGDIFLNGIANHPWLPLILAGLSVAGVFAGILLRVRAFLFLGTGFLVLSLLAMIYHAAEDLGQTWIWFACLVVLGLLIFAGFAVVEKKRQELLQVIDRIKQWEG